MAYAETIEAVIQFGIFAIIVLAIVSVIMKMFKK